MVDAIDELWDNCKAHLVEKSRRVVSVNRTEKMQHHNDIIDAVSDLLRTKKGCPDVLCTPLGCRDGRCLTTPS